VKHQPRENRKTKTVALSVDSLSTTNSTLPVRPDCPRGGGNLASKTYVKGVQKKLKYGGINKHGIGENGWTGWTGTPKERRWEHFFEKSSKEKRQKRRGNANRQELPSFSLRSLTMGRSPKGKIQKKTRRQDPKKNKQTEVRNRIKKNKVTTQVGEEKVKR